MNRKYGYKWVGLAASIAIVIMLFNGWILLPGFYKDSYFKFSPPEGMGTSGGARVLTIFVREDVEVRFFSRCHHYPFQDHSKLISDRCWIKIFLEGSNLKFSNHTGFAVERIGRRKKHHQIDIWVDVFETEKEWAQLSFKDSRHPDSIRLYVPALTKDGEVIDMPVMKGDFVERIRFSFGW